MSAEPADEASGTERDGTVPPEGSLPMNFEAFLERYRNSRPDGNLHLAIDDSKSFQILDDGRFVQKC